MLNQLHVRIGSAVADIRYNWKSKVRRARLHLVAFALFALGIFEAVNPYALSSLLPERWAAVVPIAFGVIVWMLRKVADNPPVVTTTYQGEGSVTDPAPATQAPTQAAVVPSRGYARMAEDFGHGPGDDRLL